MYTGSRSPFRRQIAAGKLRALLAPLSDDTMLEPNNVGNLSIRDADNHMTGWVDIADERIESVDFERKQPVTTREKQRA